MKSPSAPNPYQTAQAQTQSNKDTAAYQTGLNEINQQTPYGSITYSGQPNGTGGAQTVTTALNPQTQQLVNTDIGNAQGAADIQHQLQNNAAAATSKPLDLSWGATEANLDTLGRNTLDPLWQQSQDHLQAQLASQGIHPGNVAYDNAMRNFSQQKQDAYNSLYLQGHQTAVNDLTSQYNSPINTLSALQSQTQIAQPGVGQTASTPQTSVAPTNIEGLINSNYNQRLQQYNAQLGGLFGLGGSAIGLATTPLGGTAAGAALGIA